MQRGRPVALGLVAVVLLTAAWVATAAPRGITQPARIAVVDFGRLLKECEQVKAADTDFRALQETLAKEAETRIAEVKALRQKLAMHVAGSEAHKKTRDEIEKKAIANDTWYKTKMRGLAEKQQEILQGFFTQVEQVTADYAKAHGLSLVLKVDRFDGRDDTMQEFRSRMMLKKVIYSANDVDITDDVMALLNVRHRRGRVPK